MSTAESTTGPAGSLASVLDATGTPVGTCFQLRPTILVSAWHIFNDVLDARMAQVQNLDGDGARVEVRVAGADPDHDLVVLGAEGPLPSAVPGIVDSDGVNAGTSTSVTGVSSVPDPRHHYHWLEASGRWEGATKRDTDIRFIRMTCSSLMRGMSGAPVRLLDGQVAGVVSGRYNSDSWMQHSVWVSRTEDLRSLLGGLGLKLPTAALHLPSQIRDDRRAQIVEVLARNSVSTWAADTGRMVTDASLALLVESLVGSVAGALQSGDKIHLGVGDARGEIDDLLAVVRSYEVDDLLQRCVRASCAITLSASVRSRLENSGRGRAVSRMFHPVEVRGVRFWTRVPGYDRLPNPAESDPSLAMSIGEIRGNLFTGPVTAGTIVAGDYYAAPLDDNDER